MDHGERNIHSQERQCEAARLQGWQQTNTNTNTLGVAQLPSSIFHLPYLLFILIPSPSAARPPLHAPSSCSFPAPRCPPNNTPPASPSFPPVRPSHRVNPVSLAYDVHTMNFFSQFGNLPTIHTRKALLLLDIQNDFVRPSGALHVPNTADFLDTLPQLANAFRRNGEVVWVRSHYESPQPLVSSSDAQDLIVLGRMDNETRRTETVADGSSSPGGSSPVDEEAFLSVDPPRCCVPQTPGAQFPAPILAAINTESDTLIDKTDYSALQDPGLILSFRTSFVTEIYLCGSLSNVSVYATALDAVRHGFAVTLVEDCLGFRSFTRHEEAMRRMADIFGANGITTQELSEELDWEETDAIARRGSRPLRSLTPAGIEGVMDELEVKPGAAQPPKEESPESTSSGPRQGGIEDLLADMTDNEDGDLQELANLTRARSRYGMDSHRSAPQAGSGEKKIRSRVRRPKRPDSKVESPRSEKRPRGKAKKQDVYRPGDVIGEGDSRIVYDLDLPLEAFEKIRDEVAWQKMYHLSGQVPRLVAVQGRLLPDGSAPIYRHPADESPPLHPFTATVDRVRAIIERILGHPLNHALIQLYRDGQDRISEHSDKTLDIVRGSSICNVSLGAQRVMVLRTKGQGSEDTDSGRLTQRIPMPHESLFVLGQNTNMRWLHGIRPDKRAEAEKSIEERAYGGARISLTFRHIGTFLDPAGDMIWGQGAVAKSQDTANPVIHGDAAETERIILAFGQENHATEFNWDGVYGSGFDVVNFVTAFTAKLILGSDPVANLRVRLCLGENGIRYKSTTENGDGDRPVYIAADGAKLAGGINILTHFAERSSELVRPGVQALRGGSHLPAINQLLSSWRAHPSNDKLPLPTWEDALDEQPYLNGPAFGIDDCALWPVLREIAQTTQLLPSKTYPNLSLYYNRVEKRGIVKTTLEEIN
ncbi:isochorismatase family protein family [Aspergillus ellipticus CBS 707.79]|uniref:Isochorismatase family protein family n=1 Tax=Aspergillus ellipticus CBS 707.79 TaxID=1448320 RepID=A0A319DKG1_9EURO|nr:isochorismatase family protein family [Aspergillus ellipticus CBS 707.79]